MDTAQIDGGGGFSLKNGEAPAEEGQLQPPSSSSEAGSPGYDVGDLGRQLLELLLFLLFLLLLDADGAVSFISIFGTARSGIFFPLPHADCGPLSLSLSLFSNLEIWETRVC